MAKLPVSIANARDSIKPFHQQLDVGFDEPGAGGNLAWRLAVLAVAVPGGLEHFLELVRDGLERRIVEPGEEPFAKLFFRQRNERRLMPDRRFVHGSEYDRRGPCLK